MRNIIKLLMVGLVGLTAGACATETTPTPNNGITAETIAKINAYGTSKGVTLTRTSDDILVLV